MTIVKELIAFFIRFSGITLLIRRWPARRKASIIVYHDPDPKTLALHLKYLTQNYTVIPLQTLIDAILSKDSSAIPPNGMVITIDDGHAGNYQLLDLFMRRRIRPTIYVSTHIVGTNRCFWPSIAGKGKDACKKISHRYFLDKLQKDFDWSPVREYDSRQALTFQEIHKMSAWADFQCHGKYHFSLPLCDDATAREEIAGSKKALEKMLLRPCGHFAFPFGDYSEREVVYLRAQGFMSGRTTDPGFNGIYSDPFKLKIIAMIPDHASLNMLCAQLSGLPNLAGHWVNRFLKKDKRPLKSQA